MVAVGMVEAAINEVIDVIAVRHRLVSATRSVVVPVLVGAGVDRSGAAGGILCGHFEGVLLDRVVRILVMEVAVVQVVEVITVTDRGVSASVAVLVIVVFVEMGAHDPGG